MENKKSFILHLDSLDILDEITDEQAGQLFKAIKAFHNDNEVTLDPLVKMVFIPFKNQFLRDNEKWIGTKEKRALAGSLGGKQKVANANKIKQTPPVSENVSVSDKEKENVNEKENENGNDTLQPSLFSFDQFWDLYNKKTGLTKCESIWEELTQADKAFIKERLPAYIKATEDEVYFRKDPATWLSGKHWLDEHIPIAKQTQYKSAMVKLAETGSYE
jgi:Family of unknown function (DUF6291)